MALEKNINYAVEGHTRLLRVSIDNSKGTAPLHYYRGTILSVNPGTGFAVANAGDGNWKVTGICPQEVEIPAGETAEIALETGRIWLDFPQAARAHVGKLVGSLNNVLAIAHPALPAGALCGRCIDAEPGARILVDFDMKA